MKLSALFKQYTTAEGDFGGVGWVKLKGYENDEVYNQFLKINEILELDKELGELEINENMVVGTRPGLIRISNPNLGYKNYKVFLPKIIQVSQYGDAKLTANKLISIISEYYKGKNLNIDTAIAKFKAEKFSTQPQMQNESQSSSNSTLVSQVPKLPKTQQEVNTSKKEVESPSNKNTNAAEVELNKIKPTVPDTQAKKEVPPEVSSTTQAQQTHTSIKAEQTVPNKQQAQTVDEEWVLEKQPAVPDTQHAQTSNNQAEIKNSLEKYAAVETKAYVEKISLTGTNKPQVQTVNSPAETTQQEVNKVTETMEPSNISSLSSEVKNAAETHTQQQDEVGIMSTEVPEFPVLPKDAPTNFSTDEPDVIVIPLKDSENLPVYDREKIKEINRKKEKQLNDAIGIRDGYNIKNNEELSKIIEILSKEYKTDEMIKVDSVLSDKDFAKRDKILDEIALKVATANNLILSPAEQALGKLNTKITNLREAADNMRAQGQGPSSDKRSSLQTFSFDKKALAEKFTIVFNDPDPHKSFAVLQNEIKNAKTDIKHPFYGLKLEDSSTALKGAIIMDRKNPIGNQTTDKAEWSVQNSVKISSISANAEDENLIKFAHANKAKTLS